MGTATLVKVTIGSAKLQDADLLAFTVERDMGQPDMATIVLSNQEANYSADIKVADAVEIKVGDEETSIYKGEVTGLEAHYKGGEKTRLTIRAMNKLHLLLRKRKSITFTDKGDKDILSQVVGDGGLSLEFENELASSITYKHVYQHNQNDLEFLRMRAARIGCHVWCVDSKVFAKEPKLDQSPMVTLKIGKSAEDRVREFRPRLSSTSIVKKVTVKGWNPETKELIQGDYEVKDSRLGQDNVVTASKSHGTDETFMVDTPIWSVSEAKALAKARLVDLSLSYITGEIELSGDPKFELGKVIEVQASTEANKKDDPFNGNYYTMGVTHRWTLSKTKDGGFKTILRLARDAQKPKG